ncbi:hypothetical protein K458DRAFT_464309 [Lentithecium fluviatile CBS 122367]|uniref:Helicase ATP-binding domain-containing protein n=1 Tax=Lentithecium fluviatile CBS 122367 TaxID=1168545 RepID=A0A6G1IIZ9_9PLEO|nr:hypothetical protein K458DRAFT_464309 [Lentithecium fluviatile CBS 122367]
MRAPVPSTVVGDAVLAPSKRRRLTTSSALEPEAEPPATCTGTQSPRQICDNTIVCFGMVATIAPSCAQEPVFFSRDRELRRCVNRDLVGKLVDYAAEVLSRLAADEELILQLTFSASRMADGLDTKPPKGTVGFLGTIIYGPKRRSGDVGYFMTQCGYYLEDPTGCDWNVPYVNPQCLFSLHEDPPMTLDLPQMQQNSVDHLTSTASDILAKFETTAHLAETTTPTALRTTLQAHQREALTFFKRREQGLHPSENAIGTWSRRSNAAGDIIFVNTFTKRTQSAQPPIWRGGLLADEMGLGKTLSMIALIASDQDCDAVDLPIEGHSADTDELHSTLVVVPLNVLFVWESQLKCHVHTGRLTWFIHHGKNRLRLSNAAKPPDVVFTTYQTVEREKRNNKLRHGSIFSYHWKRIILDEAHIIRNYKTATARAIAALRATSRWAMSGTPIQNNLTDFLGLFKFLHFVPYDDPRVFDDDISNLWRSKPVEEAIDIFKKLLSCVMIRRTKLILELPSREDKIVRLSFDYLEEEHYRRVEQPVAEMLNSEAEAESNNPGTPWLHAIQQINKLRLICNLGTSAPSRQSGLIQSEGGEGTLAVLAARLSMGGETCGQCLQLVDASPSGIGLEGSASSNVYYSACLRFFCAGCAILARYQTSEPCACTDHSTSCPLRPLLPLLPTPRFTSTGDFPPSQIETDNVRQISSKVRTLVSQIQAHPMEKNVVFSSWTSSLDMVQRALQYDSIQFVRIDGKVATKKRKLAMHQFHNDPNTRVILITTSCGACGLDLTAASRHILKVQDRKKLLATTLLSNNSSLENLRQLLHGG